MSSPAARIEATRAVVAMLTAVAQDDWDTGSVMIHGQDSAHVVGALAGMLLAAWRRLAQFDGESVDDKLRRMGAELAALSGDG